MLGLLSQTSVAGLMDCLIVGLTTIQGVSAQMDSCIYPGLLLDTTVLLQLGVLVAQVSWRLVGTVATILHTVCILLVMQATLVVQASRALPVMCP